MSYQLDKTLQPLWERAICFIALNDDPGGSGAYDVVLVSAMISVTMVAEIFQVPRAKVARAVIRRRRKEWPDDK